MFSCPPWAGGAPIAGGSAWGQFSADPHVPSPALGSLVLAQAAGLSPCLPLPPPGLVHRPPSIYTGDQDPLLLQTWTSNPVSVHKQPPHFCPQLGPRLSCSSCPSPLGGLKGAPPQAQTTWFLPVPGSPLLRWPPVSTAPFPECLSPEAPPPLPPCCPEPSELPFAFR